MNRQNWSIQEDNGLRILVDKLGISDWTLIAENLRHQREGCTRTGKQCRQRWYNHLIPTVNKKSWTQQQQNKLFHTHRHYGNKWKDIAKEMKGRTDNDIKNHFYSTLRRSLRRLNKIIGEKNSTSQIRQIKPSVLTKIMDFIYKNQSVEKDPLLASLKDLPMLILQLASFKPKKINVNLKLNQSAKEKIQTILTLVTEFNNSYCQQKKNNKILSEKSNKNEKQSESNHKQQDQQEQQQNSLHIEDMKQQYQENQINQYGSQVKLMANVKTEAEVQQMTTKKPYEFNFNKINTAKMMFQQDIKQLPMMSHFDDFSLFSNEGSNIELMIVGTHWSPKSWEKVEGQQLDQVFQLNYDNQ